MLIMHEASLIAALLSQVHDLAAKHESCRIVEVRVEVGPLAGVEPVLLHEAFERLKPGTSAATAELSIDAVGLRCQCRECRQEYETPSCEFVCPHCRATRVDIVSGDAVMLESITLATIEESLSA